MSDEFSLKLADRGRGVMKFASCLTAKPNHRCSSYFALFWVGVLLLLFSYKYATIFLSSDAGIVLFRIMVPLVIIASVIFLAKIAGWCWHRPMLLLIGMELMFTLLFKWAALRLPVPAALIHFLRMMYMDRCKNVVQFDEKAARYDSVLFYTLRPGRIPFDNMEFSTTLDVNSAGFRDDEASLQEPELIFLGDSFTMGWGVGQSETFVAHTERQMRMKALNLGMSSYGTAREVLALQRMNLKNTKVVILQYGPFDEEENRVFAAHQFRLPLSSRDDLRRAVRWNNLWKNWFPFKYSYVALFNFLSGLKSLVVKGSFSEPVLTALSPQQLGDFAAILHYLRRYWCGKIVLINFCQYGTENSIARQFQEMLSRLPDLHPVEVLDMSEILSKEDFFVLDDHLNAVGHEKVGNFLSSHLRQ